ncbi:putative ferric-chelate reductase 1 isoform X2 [Etheostoma spectabile]|uniref:putative ferric-chelate reductase 1 isoform X2 n=1 Tax=Etheostoma spectabile TaxID=54343 RepID=UPI0013AEDF7A|nr:putative ferric-chelate reductase 1 isoform X2 [Etheostoma spectabile]
MERGLILLVAAVGVYVASGVQGISYLSFSNNTQVNISQIGCGVTKLCVQTPANCDPTGNTSCLFASVISSTSVAPNGSAMSFQLRGDSVGYIALGLTVNASQGTTMLFICAQNSSKNGSFFFQTMDQNNINGALTPADRIITEIRGIVNENVIKCEFNVLNAKTPSTILLGTGTVTNNGLSPFNISLNSDLLNLANPASNVPTTAPPVVNTTVASTTVASTTMASTTVASTTMASTTMVNPTMVNPTVVNPTVASTTMASTTVASSSGAVPPHAMLLLLSVLTLYVLLRA